MAELKEALIGHTGLVGSNLTAQHHFSHLYNSRNIDQIQANEFDLVVCAGAPGNKRLANQDPEQDKQSIQKLMTALSHIRTNKLVLISTIDVLHPVEEKYEDAPIDLKALFPYAKHRRELELFVRERFQHALIIRLPGIFGNGLKKNPIYDMMSGNLQYVNPNARLQFYSLEHLWNDIRIAQENFLKVLNIATEPTSLTDIAQDIFSITLPASEAEPVNYDMRSHHAKFWRSNSPYLYQKERVFEDLRFFVRNTTKDEIHA